MVAGWVVSLVMAASGSNRTGQGAFEALWVAVILSAVVSIYCLTLPHTPPLATGPRGQATLRASLQLVRSQGVAVFLLTSFGVYLTMPLVFQIIPRYLEGRGLPRAWVSSAMTLGQTTEIVLLAGFPWLLRRFGIKATLTLGISAWLVRFFSLALQPPLWVAVAGTLLHGVGFACFTVGGQVYIDARAPGHLRASAQSLLLVGTSGLGALLGSLIAGEITQGTHPIDVLVFLIPCVIEGALLLYFLRGFQASASSVAWAGTPNVELSSPPQSVRGQAARVGQLVTESADG
jgi:MFS family permease